MSGAVVPTASQPVESYATDAEVAITPTPSAPAVLDWSIARSASGDAAAAAAGEGLAAGLDAGFPDAPAAA